MISVVISVIPVISVNRRNEFMTFRSHLCHFGPFVRSFRPLYVWVDMKGKIHIIYIKEQILIRLDDEESRFRKALEV